MGLITDVSISKKSMVCALVAGQAISYYYSLAPAEDVLVRLALPGTLIVCKTLKNVIDNARGKNNEQVPARLSLSMSDLEVAATTAMGALAASQFTHSPSEALLTSMAGPGTWLTMRGLYGMSREARNVTIDTINRISLRAR